ncbi:MAG: DUF2207 domain-containing protein [Candidatus Levyibacteriota bacterium]|nr:MAG: DUF2207 domain-containing protein [Candidatus Levybacteria bacterium]
MRKILFLFLCFIFLAFAPLTHADEGWIIENFQSNVIVEQNGKVNITETIDVNFGTLQKHGIYRDIPNIYYDQNNKNTYADIYIVSILKDGANEPYQQSQNGNFLRLKIGKPNQTFSGSAKYSITYTTVGILKSFSDHDELYLDVTGNGWPVPILKTSARISLPQSGITGARCFEGIQNASEKCVATITSQNQADFSATRILQAEENMSILLGYTKGMVPILTASKPQGENNDIPTSLILFNIGGFLATTIFGIGLTIFFFFKHGRDQKNLTADTIVAQYFAPDKLRPAEVGTILDERADTLDVSATIVDLAARGFLTITEQEKKWVFGSADYILKKGKKGSDTLLTYEKLLFERLFIDGDTVKISELEKNFYTDLALVKKSLYTDVLDKKYFSQNPESVRNKYARVGFTLFITGIVLSFVIFPLMGIWIGLSICGFALLIISRYMPRRTKLGYETYIKILGFKLFIDKAENYRQQFFEKENMFNEILPYAIVFGNTEKFANALKKLGIELPQPNWYISNHAFNAMLFTSNMNHFSNSLTSAIAAQPTKNSFASSGSGFSSGGGFSGGGFGGGGGGSW